MLSMGVLSHSQPRGDLAQFPIIGSQGSCLEAVDLIVIYRNICVEPSFFV